MLRVHRFILLRLVLQVALSCGQVDPSSLNGGSVLAMAGEECVALAVDKRFGLQSQMVNISPRHVLIPHPHLVVAFTGLESDVQSLSLELSVQVSSKLGRGFLGTTSNNRRHEQRKLLSPHAMARLTSHVLYNSRHSPYFVEPLVVGLEPVAVVSKEFSIEQGGDSDHETDNNQQQDGDHHRKLFLRPFLCSHDMIGAQSRTDAFCCAGVASRSLYGTAEALWKPGMQPEELAAVCGKAFLSALERDCLSGYGARIILITKDGIQEFDLACRND